MIIRPFFLEHKAQGKGHQKKFSVEGRLGSAEAALLRGFPLAGRGPVRPKPDEERLQPVGASIKRGDGAPPRQPTQRGGWGAVIRLRIQFEYTCIRIEYAFE